MPRLFRAGLRRRAWRAVVLALYVSCLLSTPLAAAPMRQGTPAALDAALSSAFSYQGRLAKGGVAVNATCAMTFALFDALSGGNKIGNDQAIASVSVADGIFNVLLNSGGEFGATAFDGSARFLQIAVTCPDDSKAVLLARQQLTASPYALTSLSTEGLQGRPVSASAPNVGQALAWDGSKWTPQNLSGGGAQDWSSLSGIPAGFADNVDNDSGGDITAVSAGSGLTGGGNAGAVKLALNTSVTDGRYWQLQGNSGVAAGAFLGTTDSATLTLAVSNTTALRIVPSSQNGISAPNLIGGAASNTVKTGVGGALIGGGADNQAWAQFVTVAGGNGNLATHEAASVGGGEQNIAAGSFSTIGGGSGNNASQDFATVGGGNSNEAGQNATVAGGSENQANALFATVGGGQGNQVVQDFAVIGGGEGNRAQAVHATIGGGQSNLASGDGAVIAGGVHNFASGDNSMIPGGVDGVAALFGQFAFSAGGFPNEPPDDHGSAQTSIYVLRGDGSGSFELHLNGKNNGPRLQMRPDTSMTFLIYVIGRSLESSGSTVDMTVAYRFEGVAIGDHFGSAISLSPTVSKVILFEPADSNLSDHLDAAVSGSMGALLVSVTNTIPVAPNMHWVATVYTTEVAE